MTPLEKNFDFINHEKEILTYWEKDQTFNKLLEKNKDGQKYRFIDGPITANNPMKTHHTWGRSLKDTFLRYKAMNGYTSHYRNGFDGQGLWVEVEVEKELGFKTKKDIENFGLDNFTNACVDRVKKYAAIITEQSKRLGQWMNWDNSYYTFTDENITSIWAVLKKCADQGWIKQTYQPMPWCVRCGTSLSEHEMTGSYHDVEHEAVFFKLPIVGENTNILVWTTTPWTLSANVALAVNPVLTYVKVLLKDEEQPLILCENVFNSRFKKEGQVLASFKGQELENKQYETCFPQMDEQKNIDHKIVLWDEVSDEDGSGIVHIAPGCGAEDFELGQSKGLDIIVPIDESGYILDGFDFMSGQNAKEVNQLVFDELQKQNKLFLVHKIKHSYPFCWRCKEDILFRLGKEWAIDVEELRPRLIANAKTVKWYPEYQGKRMLDWLENMSSWNISRRRFYGLPLPFYQCECGHLEVIGSREELKAKAKDPEKVDELKELHRPWIDEITIICPECGKEINRVEQVGDVWLDAGIVPYSTLKYFTDREYWQSYFPAEYVVEMHEQIRLWFYSMLFMSTVLEDCAPYEAVGTHGMITAEDGTRFSKTGFNIDFEDVAEKIGVDATRYLFIATNPYNDVRFGFSLGEEAKKKLMSFYNTIVFFNTYAALDKIDLTNFKPQVEELNVTDKWLIRLTNQFISDTTNDYENYNGKDVTVAFEKYLDDVSNFYIRVNRRRFWKSDDDVDKKVAYYSLFYAIKTIIQVMAPIIPFMTEFLWQNFILKYDTSLVSSVHLSDWPKESEVSISDEYLEVNNTVRNIITLVLKVRNEAGIKVRQPLSVLYINHPINDIFTEYQDIITSELNVKQIVNLADFSTLKEEYLTLNFKEAGQVLKDQVNAVKNALESVAQDPTLIASIKNNQVVTIGEYNNLPSTIFNILYKEKATIKIAEENSLMVALELNITDELKEEGIIRDVIRSCQVFRKEAGFNVEDRINISFVTDDESLKSILKKNEALITRELLATCQDNLEGSYTGNIDDSEIKLQVKMSLTK